MLNKEDLSLADRRMSLTAIIEQAESIKDYSASFDDADDADPAWRQDVEAMENVICILDALHDAGATDVESALDILHDYSALAKQYQSMHKKFEVAGNPRRNGEKWLCPDCGHRILKNHTHCHWCGKRLAWR